VQIFSKLFLIFLIAFLAFFSFSKNAWASTIVTENISENTTWDVFGSPYVIENSVTIDFGAVLNISAGVVVKAEYGVEIGVYGSIVAGGMVSDQIIFTSIYDDDVLGDTNGDGSSEGLPGDWFGFSVYDGGSIDMSYSKIIHGSFGIYADINSSTTISNSSFEENIIPIERHVGAIFYLNQITYLSNLQDVHFLFGNTDGLSGDLNLVTGAPYVFYESFIQTPSFGISFEPGVIVKFYDAITSASFVDVSIMGTNLSPIIFTSYYDDSVGGDTDGFGGEVSEIYFTWGDLDFSGSISISNLLVKYEYFGVEFSDAVGSVSESTISNGLSCVDIFGTSALTFSYFECIDTVFNGVSVWNESSVVFDHVEIYNSGGGVSLFDNAEISGSYFTISNENGASSVLQLYNNSSVTLSNLIALGNGFSAIDILNNASLSLSNSIIRNYYQVGYFDTTGDISISTTNMRNLEQGFYISNSGNLSVSDSAIITNDLLQTAVDNFTNATAVYFENNWFGSASGPHHDTQNPTGSGSPLFGNNIDFTPWLLVDPYPEGPSLDLLGQYKIDGLMPVLPGAKNISDIMVFKSIVLNYSGLPVKFEMEIKPNGVSFDGQNTISSSFVSSGLSASISKNDFVDGLYHFRARAVSSDGLFSFWNEFNGSNGHDFEIKQVPHYTQIISPHPSIVETTSWANEQLGLNVAECSTIQKCGCVITDLVMLMRYYGIEYGVDGLDVDPKNFNLWLKNNDGYSSGGEIIWSKLHEYTSDKLSLSYSSDFYNQSDLNSELNLNKPVMVKEKYLRNNILRSHFILVTNKLQDNYEIKDPAWYNTKYLDSESTDFGGKIVDYNNLFNGYKKFNFNPIGSIQNILGTVVNSPADFVFIDPIGRRLGKDPNTGISYNEIPNAFYMSDVVDSIEIVDSVASDTFKSAYIYDPIQGDYNLSLMGTGNGEVVVDSFAQDESGESFTSISTNTFNNAIENYSLEYTTGVNTEVVVEELPDIQSPKADISIDTNTWTSVIDGLDTSGEPTIVNIGNNYTLTDAVANTTLFALTPNLLTNSQKKYIFSNFIQNGQIINIPLTRVEYTRQLGQQNVLKKLIQKITVKDVVTVEAVYNESVSKTVITKKYPNPNINPVTIEIFDGVKIIHLTAVNGQLGYEY